jgi:AcrR family transcriptional regulator
MTQEPRARSRRSEDRRAAILEAAAVRFHRGGYGGTSLEDIAGDLGLTAPALYRHVGDKRALYTATLEANLAHLERAVGEATSAADAVGRLARVAIEQPTLGLVWNTDRRRLLLDPEQAIARRLDAAADALAARLGVADPGLGRLLAGAVLAGASSTGFYTSTLTPAAQAAQLEHALGVIAGFQPRRGLVALEVSDETEGPRPWTTRRTALLDAAASLAAEPGGYAAMSIERVAARAGVGPNTVYLHFGGKSDLFAAVLRRAANWLGASLQQALAGAASAPEALRLAVAGALDRGARHPSWTGRLADELAALAEPERAGVTALVEEYLEDWFALCQAVAPELPAAAVRVRMRVALAVVDDRPLAAAERRVLAVEDMGDLVAGILRS